MTRDLACNHRQTLPGPGVKTSGDSAAAVGTAGFWEAGGPSHETAGATGRPGGQGCESQPTWEESPPPASLERPMPGRARPLSRGRRRSGPSHHQGDPQGGSCTHAKPQPTLQHLAQQQRGEGGAAGGNPPIDACSSPSGFPFEGQTGLAHGEGWTQGEAS